MNSKITVFFVFSTEIKFPNDNQSIPQKGHGLKNIFFFQFIYISINSVIFYFDFSVKLRFCNDCILLQASKIEKNATVLHNIHVILEASSLVHDYVLLK